MSRDVVATVDPRTPTPTSRFNIRAAVLATAGAAALYVLALAVNETPPVGVAGVMFVAPPACAVLALVVLRARRHSEPSLRLDWFSAGLTVATVGMVLQVASFPPLAPGGGFLRTGPSASGALYLLFHTAAALGALLGALRAPRRWQRPFVVVGALVTLAVAAEWVPVPVLFDADGQHTTTLVALDLVVAVLTTTATVAWIVRGGRTPHSLLGWVGVSQSLATYELLLHTVSVQRFTAVWWASVGMRVASYAVLAVGLVIAVLRQLRRWERYTADELDRRESQLRESLTAVQRLLAQATEASTALQRELLPPALSAPADVEVTGRYRGAGAHDGIGGDWYDTVLLPDGGLALVIGDVEGHDLTAAALMGQVRAAVRSYALEGHPPAVLLQRVNGFLLGSGIDRLVSVGYVQLYPGDRLATLALAGHPPPLLVPASGGRPQFLDVQVGVPLGIGTDQQWEERTVLLPADVSVVLYTDGLVQTGAHEEQFGRLLPAAVAAGESSLEALADTLVAAVEGPGRDDVAVLAARVASPHRPAAERLLPVQPMSGRIARRWLGDLVDVWLEAGALVDGPRLRDQAAVGMLLLTELVSNAIRHGEQSIRVRVALTGTVLRVEVVDSGHRMPAVRTARDDDTSGRGLRLVEAMADAWGITPGEHGKGVWFTVDLAGPEADEARLLALFDDAAGSTGAGSPGAQRRGGRDAISN